MSAAGSAISASTSCSSERATWSSPRSCSLYREEKLAVRRRGGRKRAIGTRAPMRVPAAPNDRWSLDFVSDQLTDGRRFRVLTVVDDCTRECLALVADTSLSGTRGVREPSLRLLFGGMLAQTPFFMASSLIQSAS